MRTSRGFEQSYRELASALLSRAPGFDRCPLDLLARLTHAAQVTRVDSGDVVMRRGERTDRLLLVVEGALEARISLPDRRRHLLAFVLPGMLVGYLAYLDDGPQVHDLVAHLPTVLLCIPEPIWRDFCQSRPELLRAMHIQLAARLRVMYETLVYGLSFSLRERLARQLMVLVEMVGVRRSGDWSLDLKISQSDLADLLGASRQAVNTELQLLQDAGLVRVARARIEVLDLDGLRAELPPDMSDITQRLV